MLFGIFDVDNIKNTIEYENLYKQLEENNQIEDISYDQKNSFILTEDKGIVKGYISNIGTSTIRKRKIV